MEIIPAIMPKSFEDMRNKMAQVFEIVPLVQLDIMDGFFVADKTFPFFDKDRGDMARILAQEDGLPYWNEIDVELDLMVKYAHKDFATFVALGPKRIIFHIEAEGNTDEFKDFLEAIDMYTRENIEIGVAINNDTPIENIYPLIPHVSFVQCMGIAQIGLQGEEFDERVLERITILKDKFPNLDISVDGSVNKNTILALKEAGANRFVVGSAIFGSVFPEDEIAELQEIIN